MPHYLLDQKETERLYFRRLVTNDFDNWLPFIITLRAPNFGKVSRKIL